jgi:hypothetical protein
VRIIEADYMTVPVEDAALGDIQNEAQLISAIAQMETQMRAAAKNFEFERAAALRDKIRALKQRDLGEIFAPAENPAENPGPGTATPSAALAIETSDKPPDPSGIQAAPKPRGLKAKASKKSV